MQAGRLRSVHLSCLGEISAGFRAHPLYTPMKKYNSICVGSFRRARQPFVKCGVIQRLFLQRSSAESPSWQFCRQISKFPALWKVSGQTPAPLQCCSPGRCFCGQVCRVPSSPNANRMESRGLRIRGLAHVPLQGISWKWSAARKKRQENVCLELLAHLQPPYSGCASRLPPVSLQMECGELQARACSDPLSY